MNFLTYAQQYNNDENELLGKQFYVCEYLLNTNKRPLSSRPLRNVKPTLVVVAPKTCGRYNNGYNIVLKVMGKRGTATDKEIDIFNVINGPINIFETLEESIFFYNKQLAYAQYLYQEQADLLAKRYKEDIIRVEQLKIK